MLAAQASMAPQSRKSPAGARTAFTITRSAKDRRLVEGSKENPLIPKSKSMLELSHLLGMLLGVLHLDAEGADAE